jgi:hypothetical protein
LLPDAPAELEAAPAPPAPRVIVYVVPGTTVMSLFTQPPPPPPPAAIIVELAVKPPPAPPPPKRINETVVTFAGAVQVPVEVNS